VTKGTKAVVISIVAVVLGLGAGWLVLQLASSGNTDVRLGDDEFNAGYTEVLAREIDEGFGQPLIFNDVSGGDRDIYVQHIGDEQNEGWTAFETRLPGEEDCFAQWNTDAPGFFSSCDEAVTFPADGEGLTEYPVEITTDERLVIDLR
jgi:hypothetical protein